MGAKSWQVQAISDPQAIQISALNGIVNGFTVQVNLNLGDRGIQDQVDLWPIMNIVQKATIQTIYNQVKTGLSSYYGLPSGA